MHLDVRRSRERVTVGPVDGPTMKIPAVVDITATGVEPYDLGLRLAWDEDENCLTLRELKFSAPPQGERVRMSRIASVNISQMIERILEAEILGAEGWPGVVALHSAADPVAVDALVYRLSLALGGQKPSATVATARGLAPSSGPKRVAAARLAGLIPPTKPGRPTAAHTPPG